MNLKFMKMEALGNDYIYVDMVENKGLTVADIRAAAPAISDRHKGVGGDGVIVIDATSSSGEIWTRIFNADGSEAEVCGNGLRCIAQIAYDRVYTKGRQEFEIILKKTGRRAKAFVGEQTVTIDMGNALVGSEASLDLNGKKITYIPVNIGNPHAVVFANDIDSIDLDDVGEGIEEHKNFPDRTNVEFVDVIDQDNIRLRVWERGVGETMACGSGLCRAHVSVKMPGGTATVSKTGDSMYLTGPVNYVFKGEYLIPIQ
jgi:diaminopimelate epimerase